MKDDSKLSLLLGEVNFEGIVKCIVYLRCENPGYSVKKEGECNDWRDKTHEPKRKIR
jgi:hypothetical protein